MATLSEDVARLVNDESTLKTAIQTLMATNQTAIDALKAEIANLQSQTVDTSGLEAVINNLESDIASVKASAAPDGAGTPAASSTPTTSTDTPAPATP